MFDPTKPYCRRDGKPARIICTDAKGPRPIIVLYPDTPDIEGIYRLNIDGTEWGSGLGQQSKFDLVNIPEKIEGWINVYTRERCGGEICPDKDWADGIAGSGRFACIKVSFTEGEGLSDD